jgi:RNA polymerase sigma factor for flagellar operon FliA
VGLAEAAREYDPEHRTQFTTFAYYRIRGAILDGLSRLAWFDHSDYNRGRYEQFADEALDPEHGVEGGPSDGAKLNEDVRWFKKATGALAVVYLMCHNGRGGGDQEVESIQRSPVETAIRTEIAEKLRRLVDGLPSDARELIRGAYFEGLSLKEAGERIGISKAWASRLHARTLQQLARALSTEND